MRPTAFRELALALPGAVEGEHMQHPDFRAGGRIFASLAADAARGMVKLPPAEQRRLTRAHPGVFEPAAGAWGRAGCTMVELAAARAPVVRAALAAAHARALASPAPRRRNAEQPRRRTRAKPRTIDEYLAGLGAEQRAALERLRRIVRAAVPRAEECISYGLPALRLDGKPFFWFGAAARHCAIYGSVVGCEDLLAGYDTSKGTIRFQADDPLPAPLVRKLVKARIARHAAPRRRR